ncbi:MAG: hypothetical protein IJ728_05975 [Selenomonadaceae bacterium]|nr:hypothetical protein [Selenomonadaceae bacterium]
MEDSCFHFVFCSEIYHFATTLSSKIDAYNFKCYNSIRQPPTPARKVVIDVEDYQKAA